MENLSKSEFSQTCIRLAKGSALSIVITLILLFIFALLLTYTNMQENIISPVVIIISAVSVLIGSSISTIKIKRNGLLNGGLVGIIYISIIYIISSITGADFNLNIGATIMLIASITMGMLGGIIGINLKWNDWDGSIRFIFSKTSWQFQT